MSEWEEVSSIYTLKTNTIRWYADGSKTDEGAGPGYEWESTLSVFQSDINAIQRCAQMNLDRNYLKASMPIFSQISLGMP